MLLGSAPARIARGPALVACLLGCASEGTSPHPQLARVWTRYQELPEARALAVAGDPRGNRWVTGASAGHGTSVEAEEGALAECRRRRAARRMRAACQIYAVGNEIVFRGP